MLDLASYESSKDSEEYAGCAGGKNPTDIKQKLLRVLTTECELNAVRQALPLCAPNSNGGPSLSHASTLTILEFFEMTTKWLDYFKQLAAPLRFVDKRRNGEVRVRHSTTRYVPLFYHVFFQFHISTAVLSPQVQSSFITTEQVEAPKRARRQSQSQRPIYLAQTQIQP
ncbi:hypothetical protein M378DRAFT_9029 [Amanita muscaria Koide BX008]|uniref:Uncharacterized protein n=1 Tax=Amanita muscaria (strain Koide BX008) TaxID=946122 RepID=A0A0C2SWA8_AMAMK|nr:hypothetical protein M378DRAFT_9029 [Amanita muscaria Koide BX008]